MKKSILRINLKTKGKKTEHITLRNTPQDKFLEFVEELFAEDVTIKRKLEKRVNIEAREAKGAHNGKSKSIAVEGYVPSEVREKILANIV